MNDEEFRAKREDNKEWVYGYYYKHESPIRCIYNEKDSLDCEHYILRTGFADWNMVRPIDWMPIVLSTLSRFTGESDKNGKKIYSGDIVNGGRYNNVLAYGIIVFEKGAFIAKPIGKMLEGYVEGFDFNRLEVIGNIFDNTNLLGEL